MNKLQNRLDPMTGVILYVITTLFFKFFVIPYIFSLLFNLLEQPSYRFILALYDALIWGSIYLFAIFFLSASYHIYHGKDINEDKPTRFATVQKIIDISNLKIVLFFFAFHYIVLFLLLYLYYNNIYHADIIPNSEYLLSSIFQQHKPQMAFPLIGIYCLIFLLILRNPLSRIAFDAMRYHVWKNYSEKRSD
jgi:hypothetical protein